MGKSADEDHVAELKALAALHGQDVDLGFPGIVGSLAAAVGHELMGDAFSLDTWKLWLEFQRWPG